MNIKFKTFNYDESIPAVGWFGEAKWKYPHLNDLLKAAADFASTIEPDKLINICTNTYQNYEYQGTKL